MKRTVLITGCSSGFGRLTAETLAGRGHSVFATMRDIDGKNAAVAHALRERAAATGQSIHVLDLDVTSDASVVTAVDAVFEHTDRLDVAVNNAGIFSGGYLEAYRMEDIQHVFDVNVYGAMRVNRAVLPHMRRRGEGLLVHVSTVAARTPFPFSVPYAASKSALEALAQGYRYELALLGIDSVIVEAGAFPTAILDKMTWARDEERAAGYEIVEELKDRSFSGLRDYVSSDDAPDSRQVATAIADLIDLSGDRPLRTVVDPFGAGIRRINEVAAAAQREVMESAGLGALVR
ncbi:MAG: SDR family oxidoreductase [Gemmatimonadetes bacterium]|nr:SDR family oxidoreductase [Gemmatimonadota bacterium]